MVALTVSVATDQATYTRNQWVLISALVSSGGSPVAGAGVTITITQPDGAVATAALTTGTNGAAGHRFRIGVKAPAGVYQVHAEATLNARSGSATASFTMQ